MNDFERSIAAAVERGQHVTTRTIGGMRTAKFHEPTNEARQAAIDEYDAFERAIAQKEGD